jgi:tripartite-type tricarboxylate transporter receptor subunit TctC
MKRAGVIACVCVFFFLMVFPVGAQKFPTRPVKIVNPYPPGGGNGLLALAFQKPFGDELGTKVIIENIPGGATKVATFEVLKARPDGYTLILQSDRIWPVYYHSNRWESKVWEQLTPIGNLTVEAWGFVEVKQDSPFKKWEDVVKVAKETPAKLNCGVAGAGGLLELFFTEYFKRLGTEIKFVPFGGAGPSKTALLGGHVDLRLCTAPEAIPNVLDNLTRGLAIATSKRHEKIPEVPTFKELGIGDALLTSRSIWGPPNLPTALVNLLAKAIEKSVKDPEFIERVENQLYYKVEYRSPEKVRNELLAFYREYGPMLEAHFK